MRRRQVLAALATGLVGALAGCSDPRASLRMDAVDDAGIAERYARDVDGLPQLYRSLVVDAVEEGAATHEGTSPPLDFDRPVGYGGSYYELSYEVVDERAATRYDVRVDYDPNESAGQLGQIDFADLPAVDRNVLDELIPPRGDPPTDEGFDLGRSAVYDPEEAERSVLVPDQAYDVVVHDGDRYLIDVDDGEQTTLRTYRYTAEQVAADDAELAAAVREAYLFELGDLTDAQREILDEAIEGTYREDEPTEAFRDLVARFRDREAIDADEYGGDWLVRYDGDEYWAELETPIDWREATVARETPTDG